MNAVKLKTILIVNLKIGLSGIIISALCKATSCFWSLPEN